MPMHYVLTLTIPIPIAYLLPLSLHSYALYPIPHSPQSYALCPTPHRYRRRTSTCVFVAMWWNTMFGERYVGFPDDVTQQSLTPDDPDVPKVMEDIWNLHFEVYHSIYIYIYFE